VRGIGLDRLASKEFNYKMISYDDVTMKQKINFKDVELKTASIYSGEDVYITYKIFKKQKDEKITENEVLQSIEIPLLRVLCDMEITGVKIDRDRLKGI
jgi:DNA polymerase-1